MSKRISRRDFLKFATIASGALLDACAPTNSRPTNILPSNTPIPAFTPEQTNSPEPTLDPYPPFEAKTWAEKMVDNGVIKEKKEGTVDPESMYRYVGDWRFIKDRGTALASSKKRSIDLEWNSLKLVYVGDKDIQESGFDRAGYRSYIAGQLSSQPELIRQLLDIKDKLPTIGQSAAMMTIVINGPEFSQNKASHNPTLNEFNPKITGIAADIGSFPKWFKYDGQKLERLRIDESPKILPSLTSINGKLIREDNGEEEMMRGINFGEYRLQNARTYSWTIDYEFNRLKEAGGNFLVVQLDRNSFAFPGFYRELANGLSLARNKYGLRIMLSLGWDKTLSGEMIRVTDQNLPNDWKTFVNFRDPHNNFVDPDQNFASFLRRNVDVFQILCEPSGDFDYFNPHMQAASMEIKSAVGPEAITGFSDGDYWATDAVELYPPEQAARFNQEHPNSAAVIHPFKLDNPVDQNDPLRSERPDPMIYLKQVKANGVTVVIGEAGWLDWDMNPDWLMKLFQFCEDNKISYAIDGDVSQISGFWSKLKSTEKSE